MDPLSISASLVAIIGAVGAITTKVNGVRHADEQLDAIRADLADIENIISSGKDIVDNHGQHIPANLRIRLPEVLNRAQQLFKELEDIIDHSLVKQKANGQTRPSKTGLAIKGSRISGLRIRLKDVKQSLGSFFDLTSL